MNRSVRLRPEAETDLEDAAGWYELQREGLGQEFLTEVERTLNLIRENPETYAVLHRGIRRAMLRRFPFGVHYQIIDDCILVFAVMHASRDPSRWKGRAG